MTEEKADEQPKYSDDYLKLKEELNAQFNELKASFEASNKEKDDIIAQLKEQNQGLQRALVRSAVSDPPKEEPKEPTEEELYQQEVDTLAKKTMEYMKELN